MRGGEEFAELASEKLGEQPGKQAGYQADQQAGDQVDEQAGEQAHVQFQKTTNLLQRARFKFEAGKLPADAANCFWAPIFFPPSRLRSASGLLLHGIVFFFRIRY